MTKQSNTKVPMNVWTPEMHAAWIRDFGRVVVAFTTAFNALRDTVPILRKYNGDIANADYIQGTMMSNLYKGIVSARQKIAAHRGRLQQAREHVADTRSVSTKNSLTLATRRALNSLATLGRAVQRIEQVDLGQMRQSSPPNTYMMELGAAQRDLNDAYAALERAYYQIRKIARKAGEPHV